MTGQDRHQRGGADDLSSAHVRHQPHTVGGLRVIQAQPVEAAVQLGEHVTLDRRGPPSTPEYVAEPARRIDEGVVQCGQVGGRQPVRFLVGLDEFQQRRRLPVDRRPRESDLVVGLDDAGPHQRRSHTMTRLLPESAIAKRSPCRLNP